MHGLFGQIEVSEDPDQGRDRPSLLLPEQAIDDRNGLGRYDGPSSNLWIGRISIDPRLTLGILDAASIASSRLSHSTR